MLSRKKIYYVYAFVDSRKSGPYRYGRWKFEYEPFYIGKGKENRAYSHSGNTHTKNKIQQILREGADPLVIIKKKKLTEKQALDLEEKLIALIGRRDLKTGPLTNWHSAGADSALKDKTHHSKSCSKAQTKRFSCPEARAIQATKYYEWLEKNPETHKQLVARRKATSRSPEYRQRASEITKAWRQNPANAAKQDEARRKVLQSQEFKEQQSRRFGGRRVRVWKGDQYVGEFVSQQEVVRCLGISACNLTKCLKYGRKESGGYRFKYSN